MIAAVLLVALGTSIVTAFIAHGILKPFLESRGVKPWRVTDTLAAIPLILIGSAGVGAALAVGAALSLGVPIRTLTPAVGALIATGVAVLSSVVLLLGVLAVRKLT